MKIIYDNIIFSHVIQGGVSNYWFELSKALMQKKEDEVIFYEEKSALYNFHRKQLQIPKEKIVVSQPKLDFPVLSRMSSVVTDEKDYFLYHSSYYRPISGSKNFSEVTTVHDFTHNYYSKFLNKLIHNKIKYDCIRRSKGIICISENTFTDLRKFCPPNKNQKVQIIHNGVSDEYFRIEDRNDKEATSYIEALNLTRSYILFVGGRVNYKNFDFTAQLLKEQPEFELVIIGGNLSQNEIKLFDKESLDRIKVISDVTNSELNLLYNFAHALVYPSSYEGFGIPIIEAMRAGCPVLALSNSSIIEVAGQAAILENDLNLGSFKRGLQDLKSPTFRNEIMQKGFEQSSMFSWKKCCTETYDFYKEIYND